MPIKTTLYVAGLPKVGKSLLIQGLIHLLHSQGHNPGGSKPFDVGLIQKNAQDLTLDAQSFAESMQGEPSTNWITPYFGNENYPIEMALRRDGIQVNWKILQQRQHSLATHYNPILVETPGGLCAPITEQIQVIDWLITEQAHLIYLICPKAKRLNETLLEIRLLQESKLEYSLVFNHPGPIKDGDFLFFQWEKVEAAANKQALGMLPNITEPDPHKVAQAITDHLPKIQDLWVEI